MTGTILWVLLPTTNRSSRNKGARKIYIKISVFYVRKAIYKCLLVVGASCSVVLSLTGRLLNDPATRNTFS